VTGLTKKLYLTVLIDFSPSYRCFSSPFIIEGYSDVIYWAEKTTKNKRGKNYNGKESDHLWGGGGVVEENGLKYEKREQRGDKKKDV
jgi:hypothetical protein